MIAIQKVLKNHGSLGNLFHCHIRDEDQTVLPALSAFLRTFHQQVDSINYLLPGSVNQSACKRMHLFLRWMVRCDEVDPGGWSFILPSKLIHPVDTHVYKLATHWGLTKRRSIDSKCALDVTRAMSVFSPSDPVKYDFSLAHMGISKLHNL